MKTKVKIEHLYFNCQIAQQDFNAYLRSLQAEMAEFSKDNYQLVVKTIYLAGDDICQLSENDLITFLTTIKQFVNCQVAEFTCEITLTTSYKQNLWTILANFGINRLVWKVGTFQHNLQKINHFQQVDYQITDVIKRVRTFGFNNFSLDLNYNLPQQTTKDILADLSIAVQLETNHISYQSFTDTENSSVRKIINDFFAFYHYDNYELFSYSTNEKFYSQQTLAYCNLKNWYGFGPNAGSFLQLNERDFLIKTNSDNHNNQWYQENIKLKQEEYYWYFLSQGLLKKQGLNLENKTTILAVASFEPAITKLLTKKLLEKNNGSLKTTKTGWLLFNELLTDMIINHDN